MRRGTRSSSAGLLLAWLCAAGFGPELSAQDETNEEADTGVAQDKTTVEQDEVYGYEREEKQAAQEGAAGFFQRSADNITSQLQAEWLRFGGFVQSDPISLLGDQWRKFNDDLYFTTRLDFGLAYTALWQRATQGTGPRSAAAGDFDFFGTWHLVGQEGRTAGVLGFATEYRHDFGGIPPSQLNRSFGSITRTANGFNTFDFTLRQLWWQQLAADGRVLMRAGKIQMSDFFNTGRFRSANFFFLNQAFSANLAVAFPVVGPGVVLFGFPSDSYYLAGGVCAADPNETSSGFSGLSDGDVFGAFEFGFVSDLAGYGPGTYRFTFWGVDAVSSSGAPSGEGFAMSFDQQLGRFIPFVRYAYNNRPGLTQIRQVASAGFGWQNPFGNKGDIFGVGVGWAHPDSRQARDEYILEAFYRIQITPTLQFTPDFQMIIDPAFGAEDVVGVFGLRFRLQY